MSLGQIYLDKFKIGDYVGGELSSEIAIMMNTTESNGVS